MTSDELYTFAVQRRYNLVLSNCYLVIATIINFEDHRSRRFQEKGFSNRDQKMERAIRALRRNVEKECEEFLRGLHAGEPFQVVKGVRGIFTSSSLNKILLYVGPRSHHSGLHYNLRHSFRTLVNMLNGAFTSRGGANYDIDRDELARAFQSGAGFVEWALAQHVASTGGRALEGDLSISAQLGSMTINNSPGRGQYTTRPTISQARTAPATQTAYAQRAPIAHTRPSAVPTVSAPSGAHGWSSTPAAPRFGVVSALHSPHAARPTQNRSTRVCEKCGDTSHTVSRCPQSQCYRCKSTNTKV
jgi:hypothetical protein